MVSTAFFDNVGGMFAVTVYPHMNIYGRICQCGHIGSYNSTQKNMLPEFHGDFIFKEVTLKGFYFLRCFDQWPNGMKILGQWIREGKLKYKETIIDGFENMPQSLIHCLEGKNIGKMIVKV